MIVYRAVWVVAVTIALVAAAGAGWFIVQTPDTVFSNESEHAIPPPATAGTTVSITVEQGESARSIGRKLADQGVIRSSRLFEVLVALTGVQDKLEAGDYEFDQVTPAIEAVHRIAEGKTASRDVVIPEGRRAEEVGEILQQAGVVSKQDFLPKLLNHASEDRGALLEHGMGDVVRIDNARTKTAEVLRRRRFACSEATCDYYNEHMSWVPQPTHK